ncbi:transposable element Tc1 transposase [Trichonephila clavipes]|nr:transposable element Tc1 transposase [Trichonephila clavipes]
MGNGDPVGRRAPETHTVKRALHSPSIDCPIDTVIQLDGRPFLGLPLTQNHRRLRRQWCDERRTWVAEWNEVVFTDESRICLLHHDGRIRVWRHRKERMLNKCVMHCHNGLARGIMLRGVIGYHFCTPLVCIAGTLNSQGYISEVLRQSPDLSASLAGLLSGYFADRNHVVHGCSTIDQDYTPSHTRSTLATCGSYLVYCTPRTHPKSLSSMPRRGAAVISNNAGYSGY